MTGILCLPLGLYIHARSAVTGEFEAKSIGDLCHGLVTWVMPFWLAADYIRRRDDEETRNAQQEISSGGLNMYIV